jgi:hypothetical protein
MLLFRSLIVEIRVNIAQLRGRGQHHVGIATYGEVRPTASCRVRSARTRSLIADREGSSQYLTV